MSDAARMARPRTAFGYPRRPSQRFLHMGTRVRLRIKMIANAAARVNDAKGFYGQVLYGYQTLAEVTTAWLAAQPGIEDIDVSRCSCRSQQPPVTRTAMRTRLQLPFGEDATSKNRSIKYVCPACDAIIRETKQANVICGECNSPFKKGRNSP